MNNFVLFVSTRWSVWKLCSTTKTSWMYMLQRDPSFTITSNVLM